ncbi:unnamed protein product [Brassica rapa subsp. trilocularis]
MKWTMDEYASFSLTLVVSWVVKNVILHSMTVVQVFLGRWRTLAPPPSANPRGCSTISLESNQTKNRPETHNHTLNLEVNFMNIKEGFFFYNGCNYARCASLSDPLYNRAHEHPLHLTDSGACCNQCDFTLKPKRATLPVLVKYKYDPHPLTLGFAESIMHVVRVELYNM